MLASEHLLKPALTGLPCSRSFLQGSLIWLITWTVSFSLAASTEAREAAASTARPAAASEQQAVRTATGLALDAPWKSSEYEFAKKNLIHPSWGLAHAERDYRNSLEIAEREQMDVDKDVLFAAAFLHDLGGIGRYQKEHVDHAVRSAELAEPLLKSWGFPMEKWEKVKETILGHVYYGTLPKAKEAVVFHDADCLDFLGDIGIARIFAASAELAKLPSLEACAGVLNKFVDTMPSKLVTKTAQEDGAKRIAEMRIFLKKLTSYTYDEKAF